MTYYLKPVVPPFHITIGLKVARRWAGFFWLSSHGVLICGFNYYFARGGVQGFLYRFLILSFFVSLQKNVRVRISAHFSVPYGRTPYGICNYSLLEIAVQKGLLIRKNCVVERKRNGAILSAKENLTGY